MIHVLARISVAVDRDDSLMTPVVLGATRENPPRCESTAPARAWDDRWALHPWPIAAEPAKYVCWLTENDDYDEDHVARLYLKATLHPIDRFFMQTRRRVSLAERSVVSVRSQRRMWSGYAAYSPAVLQRYLEICRTYYNYCLPGKDGKTPAMRLGLAKAPQKPRAILSFT